jgi:hypothetical protein
VMVRWEGAPLRVPPPGAVPFIQRPTMRLGNLAQHQSDSWSALLVVRNATIRLEVLDSPSLSSSPTPNS